jgi:hypothetical protein
MALQEDDQEDDDEDDDENACADVHRCSFGSLSLAA